MISFINFLYILANIPIYELRIISRFTVILYFVYPELVQPFFIIKILIISQLCRVANGVVAYPLPFNSFELCNLNQFILIIYFANFNYYSKTETLNTHLKTKSPQSKGSRCRATGYTTIYFLE
jgi:hypothetical protein